jgi:Zn-dependent peptidase ImmA (M78 family)
MPVRKAPRKILASSKATELLQLARIKAIPVNVERLATSLGAEVRYEPFPGDELSGMLRRQPDGRHVIGVNAMHSEARQRFTIAHELGHLRLHKDEEFHVDEKAPIRLRFRNEASGQGDDADEIEANCFAAELLMPTQFLEREIAAIKPGTEPEDAVQQLADKFNVSVQAMTIRLSAMGRLS